jgi:hypothetical protein
MLRVPICRGKKLLNCFVARTSKTQLKVETLKRWSLCPMSVTYLIPWCHGRGVAVLSLMHNNKNTWYRRRLSLTSWSGILTWIQSGVRSWRWLYWGTTTQKLFRPPYRKLPLIDTPNFCPKKRPGTMQSYSEHHRESCHWFEHPKLLQQPKK